MKTRKILGTGIGFVLMGGIVYGLTINQVINNAISYMKKMIFTVDGTDNTKSTVVIDGIKGSVSMSGNLDVGNNASIANRLSTKDLDVGNNASIANRLSTKDLNVGNNASIANRLSTKDLNVSNNAIITGNVGIGTTDPKAKLDVNGDIQSKGDIKVGYINPKNTGTFPGYGSFLRFYGGPAGNVRNSDNSDPTWIARYNVSTDHTELRINVGDNDNGDDAVNITSESGSKSLMYIKNNGNVGIGTTNPRTKLELRDLNNHTILRLVSPNNKDSTIQLYNKNLTGWAIGKSGDNGKFFINYDNKESHGAINIMTALNNGNVGIGTTNPQAKLDVNGDIKVRGDIDISNTTSNTGYAAIRNKGKWVLGVDEKKKEISIGSTYGPDQQNVVINSINGVNTLVASGGNVGIGTTDPKAKLDVSGAMNVSIDKKLNGDSRTGYNYYDYTQIAYFSNKATPLSNGDTRVLSIAQDKDGSAVIRGVGRNIRLQPQRGVLSIDGNVGIGTTNPKAKLDVNGDIQSKGDIKVGYINPKNTGTFPGYGSFLRFYGGPAGNVRNSDNSDPTWIARYNVSTDHTELRINVGDNDNGDDAVNITSENGSKSLMYIKNNGNVGIGITNPKSKLDVNGEISVRGRDAKIVANPDQSYGGRADLIGTYNGWDKKAVYIAGYNILNANSNNPSKVTNVRFGEQTLMKVDFANNKIVMNAPVYKTSCPSGMYKYGNVCIDATHSADKVNRNTAVVNCSNAGKQLCSIADVTVAMKGGLNNFTNEWLLDFSKDDYYAYINIPNNRSNPEGVDGPNRDKYKYYRCCVHLNP